LKKTVSARLPRISRVPVLLAAGLAMAGCFREMRIPPPAGVPGAIRELPVTEVPARPQAGRTVAIVLSGDAPVSYVARRLSHDLARHGIPTVRWNSFRYFWTPREPQGAADDLDRTIGFYLARAHADRVLLVGYSLGADVMPFLVNRLPPETRARIRGVVMVGLSHNALFQFHFGEWWGHVSAPTFATRPEVEGLAGLNAVCVYGVRDRYAACPLMRTAPLVVVPMPGGHTVGEHYARLWRIVRGAAARAEPAMRDPDRP
jgi:type IV secretory pathway VirJ component